MKRSFVRGSVTIEFAMGFMLFWLMVVAWVEISMMSYVSAVSDLAIAEASRAAKKETEAYVTAFYQVLNNSNSIWKDVVNKDGFTASVQYVGSIDDLTNIADVCVPDAGQQTVTCGVESGSSIAIYHISYDFKTIFTFFLDTDSVFSREVIVVQEYERDQFQI